jgi:dihydroorotase
LPYKIYLDTEPSVSNFDNWSELENAIARYQGCRVFFHAEDPDLLKGVSHTGPRWLTRPPEAEVRAVERVLDLSGKYGLRTHICHVSTRKAVERVVAARKLSSTPLTMEVTPHHLYFSVRDGRVLAEGTRIVEDSSFLGSNPPLREEDDRRYLLDALKDGVIDVLASDHAPHTMQEKADGAPGMPHLDTLGPFTAWLMARAGVAAHRVREMLATKPAAIFDQELELPRGLLTAGSEASLTIIDHEGLTQVDRGEITGRGPLKTRCGWSPFCGAVFPGRVVATVVRGTVRHFPV